MISVLFIALFGSIAIGSLLGLVDEDLTPGGDGDVPIDDDDLALLNDASVADFLDDVAETEHLIATADETTEAVINEYDFSAQDPFRGYLGTEDADYFKLPEDFQDGQGDPIFADAGNDVIVGNDFDDVLFGEDGDDILVGNGGYNQLFGEGGNDVIIGGDEADDIIMADGADVAYGGKGDDYIYEYSYEEADAERPDIINAGEGDDTVELTDGLNLIALGEGADKVLIEPAGDDNTSAVITDYNGAEDQIVLIVDAHESDLFEDGNTNELSYSLYEISTGIGSGTLVVPNLNEGDSIDNYPDLTLGYTVLLNTTPDEVNPDSITVLMRNEADNAYEEDGWRTLYKAI